MCGWLLRVLVLGVTVGGSAYAAQQSGTTISRPGTVPREGVTGPRDKAKTPTGTARIRGIVVGGEGGSALRRAMVRLWGGDLPEGRTTMTNEEGRWELRDLPAGRYELMATKTGYVSLKYGQRRPFEQGKPLEIRDAQTIENINFNLSRGSVIAGRVTDEFGDPIAEVMIAAQRYQFVNGRRQLVPVGRFSESDDGGNFRLYGLAPGEYYLSASPMGSSFGQSSDDSTGYAPTYYPGTANAQQADKVSVGMGDEVSGLQFSLVPTRTAKITGTALDSRGRPMAGAFVSVIERSGEGFRMSMGAANQVRDDGTFTLSDVAPGEYVIQARSFGASPDNEVASTPITVTGEDISGLALVATKGTVIRGRVVLDVQSGRPIQSTSVGVMAMPRDPSMEMMMYFGGESRDRLNDDWTFELRAMTSPVLIRTTRLPPGYSLKHVFWRGQDVTDSGVVFKTSDMVSDVEVVITARSTWVSGAVTGEDGKPAVDYVVVAFAEESDKWGFQSRYVALARPDQQGGFVFKQLPAGRYLAAGLPYIEDGEQSDPEFLERLRSVATPFTLAEGEQKALALKVVEQ